MPDRPPFKTYLASFDVDIAHLEEPLNDDLVRLIVHVGAECGKHDWRVAGLVRLIDIADLRVEQHTDDVEIAETAPVMQRSVVLNIL